MNFFMYNETYGFQNVDENNARSSDLLIIHTLSYNNDLNIPLNRWVLRNFKTQLFNCI